MNNIHPCPLGENLLHDYFGDVNYWAIRRAMKFSGGLVDTADQFRLEQLNSSDAADDTVVQADWREHRQGCHTVKNIYL